MKISKYVSKYDYIGYYTKQKSLWFFSNAEIEAALFVEKEKLLEKNDVFFDSENDEEQDDASYEPIDPIVFLKSKDLCEEQLIESYHNDDFDYLNKFREKLENLRNVDESNPLIIQGRILDEESKKFIIKEFNICNDFIIYDFDKNKTKLEECEQETKKLILNNNKIIIFQPVFIDYKKMIITKCDALVKDGLEIKIIETKGTTNLKKVHFLDIYYQKRLLDNIDYLSDFYLEYFLCAVKYERLNKNMVSFILSDYLNFTKAGFSKGKKKIDEKEIMNLKIGKKENGTSINDLLIKELPEKIRKYDEKLMELNEIEEQFESIIKELWEHKNKMNVHSIPMNFVPSKEDKNSFKNTDYWTSLKDIYSLKKYNPFIFSGNVINHTKLCNDNYTKKNEYIVNFKDYFRNNNYFIEFTSKPKKTKNGLEFSLLENQSLKQLINKLKNKKVYFDFETINTAIRPIDNILPFTQIVTQCSIIKDHNKKNDLDSCLNLIIDPKNINNSWWKVIIDNLYNGNDYSYVVYNKSFECKRLEEIKEYINDLEYNKKIDCIINNIFDLADFFNLSKKIFLINELYGLYSIKKVLPLIQKYAPNLFELTKCKNYKKLEISNGLICQNKSTCRFLNKVNNEEWEHIKKISKEYCENDVRAMIAVEKFIFDYLMKFI